MTITPQEHTEDMRFNDYCKEVMGYIENCPTNYNPYVDLNAMAEVVEKLDKDKAVMWCFHNGSIKTTFRDFIISTMPVSTKGKE